MSGNRLSESVSVSECSDGLRNNDLELFKVVMSVSFISENKSTWLLSRNVNFQCNCGEFHSSTFCFSLKRIAG